MKEEERQVLRKIQRNIIKKLLTGKLPPKGIRKRAMEYDKDISEVGD